MVWWDEKERGNRLQNFKTFTALMYFLECSSTKDSLCNNVLNMKQKYLLFGGRWKSSNIPVSCIRGCFAPFYSFIVFFRSPSFSLVLLLSIFLVLPKNSKTMERQSRDSNKKKFTGGPNKNCSLLVVVTFQTRHLMFYMFNHLSKNIRQSETKEL